MVSEDDELAPASRLRLPSPGPNSCSYTGCTQHSNATATATHSRSAEAEAIDHLPDSDVKEALQSIPEDFRMAVYLADVEGFAYQEIADIMKTPVGTVMSRLHRGRKLLRERLRDYAIGRGIIAADPEVTEARR